VIFIMPNKEGVLPTMEHQLKIKPSEKHLFSGDEIQTYLNNPDNVVWIEAGELCGKRGSKCIDGREEGEVVGSPAGDFGQLAEVIIGTGKQLNHQFSPVEIQQIFNWRLATFGDFYAHTDEHAIEHLSEALFRDHIVDSHMSIEEMIAYIDNPPADKQVTLLDYLTDPNYVGCGHIKQMLTDPEAYKMSRKVLQGLMRSFFNIKWNGTDEQKQLLHYDVLRGSHKEGAILLVNVKEPITPETLIPAVRPTDGDMSMFVVHPSVSAYLRTQLAEQFMNDFYPKMKGALSHSVIQELSVNGIRETASRLASGYPQYTVEL
jgi:hypothetical protein